MEFLAEIKGLDLISEFFIKSSIILIFTFVLVFLFRKKSASLRHFLLSVSLISLLLFPILSTLTKGWETGLLPSWHTGEGRSQISQRWDQDRQKSIPLNSISSSLADQQLKALKLEKNGRFIFFLSKYFTSKGFFGLLLVAIWSVGLIVLLSRIFFGLYGAHRLTRQGQRISGSSWRQLLNRFLEAISIKRKISLFSHKNVNIPLTWGVIKPVVILPAESRNWTQDQRSSALFHELSHIKRGDFLVKILARCSVALYWFNPLSWFAFRMMKKEQEKACDELVLKAGVKPSTYAVNLLSIKKAGQFHWNPPTAALGAVGKSQLNERLIAILKHQLKPKEFNMKTKILLSSLIIMTIAFIGLARPSQSEASTNEIISQEKQIKKTTKKTDKKESVEKAKKKFTWVIEDGKKIQFIISTNEEGTVNISEIDGDILIHIDKDSNEKKFTLLINDKKLVLQKDEKGSWLLQEDDKEAFNFYISTSNKKNKNYNVVYQIKGDKDNKNYNTVYRKKGDKDNKNVFYVKAPKIHIEKLEKPHGAINIHVAHKIKIPNKNIDIYISGIEGITKKIKISPQVDVHIEPHAAVNIEPIRVNIHVVPDIAISFQHVNEIQKELIEKIQKVNEKIKIMREEKDLKEKTIDQEKTLKEVQEVLKELSEKLREKSAELKDISLNLHTDVKDIHLDKDENIIVDIEKIEDHKNFAFVTTDEGKFQISMEAHFDSENKNKYEEIVNKLKKDLPKGYTVESMIDEEAGIFTINIKGSEEDKNTEKTVKEILEDLKKQLSKIK